MISSKLYVPSLSSIFVFDFKALKSSCAFLTIISLGSIKSGVICFVSVGNSRFLIIYKKKQLK